MGFDLLLFEFAHLVLFFMGLTYAAFIQWSFVMRDRYCRIIAEVQKTSLRDWMSQKKRPKTPISTLGPIGLSAKGWARTTMTLRAIMCIHMKEELQDCSRVLEDKIDDALAEMRGEPIPTSVGFLDDEAIPRHFDLARFAKCAYSATIIDLLHVPVFVWFTVVIMAGANTIHGFGIDLADAVGMTVIAPPVFTALLLWRMSVQLHDVVLCGCGHPRIPDVEYFRAETKDGSEKWKVEIGRAHV